MTIRETAYQQRLVTALTALGYARVPGRSHYVELRLAPGGRSLLKPGSKDHRVLVGPRSFRYTTDTIAKSVPFSERTVQALLEGKLTRPSVEESVP